MKPIVFCSFPCILWSFSIYRIDTQNLVPKPSFEHLIMVDIDRNIVIVDIDRNIVIVDIDPNMGPQNV